MAEPNAPAVAAEASGALSICVDAGTSLTKAVAYDDAGRPVLSSSQPTRVFAPVSGYAEQDMTEVWDAVLATIHEVVQAAGRPVSVIALTAHGDGCWLVDADRKPTGPAMLWNDARAAGIVDTWARRGKAEEAFWINGSVGFAGLPHAILAWLAENDPDRVERSDKSLTCGGWLFARLTGQVSMDESDAAVPWLDVERRVYSEEILEIFEMPWAQRLLPELRRDDNRAAPLSADAAKATGIAAGTPVVMAPYDIAASAVGSGAVETGQAVSILGTTLCTEVVAATPDRSGRPTGLTIPLGVDSKYLRALPTLAGTQVLAWAADLLSVDDEAAVCALADTGGAGANGAMFLPYLSPAGERVPFVDSAARGTFAGLSFDHDRAQIARAILEGLTYVIRECLTVGSTDPTEVRVCGGGTKSPQWCQLIADVTGVPVIRLSDDEVGARGAFVFAHVATGESSDHAEAVAKFVRTRDEFTPNAANQTLYDELFGQFVAIRDDAAKSWPRLAEIRDVA